MDGYVIYAPVTYGIGYGPRTTEQFFNLYILTGPARELAMVKTIRSVGSKRCPNTSHELLWSKVSGSSMSERVPEAHATARRRGLQHIKEEVEAWKKLMEDT